LDIETGSSLAMLLARECNTFAVDGVFANNVQDFGVLFAA
jgi:hypothetical protein